MVVDRWTRQVDEAFRAGVLHQQCATLCLLTQVGIPAAILDIDSTGGKEL